MTKYLMIAAVPLLAVAPVDAATTADCRLSSKTVSNIAKINRVTQVRKLTYNGKIFGESTVYLEIVAPKILPNDSYSPFDKMAKLSIQFDAQKVWSLSLTMPQGDERAALFGNAKPIVAQFEMQSGAKVYSSTNGADGKRRWSITHPDGEGYGVELNRDIVISFFDATSQSRTTPLARVTFPATTLANQFTGGRADMKKLLSDQANNICTAIPAS